MQLQDPLQLLGKSTEAACANIGAAGVSSSWVLTILRGRVLTSCFSFYCFTLSTSIAIFIQVPSLKAWRY